MKKKSKTAEAKIGQAVLELAHEVAGGIRLARMRYDAVCTPHPRESRGHVLLKDGRAGGRGRGL